MSGAISTDDRRSALDRVWRVFKIRFPLLAKTALANLRVTDGLGPPWRERYNAARRDLLRNDPALHPTRQWTVMTHLYYWMLRGFGVARFKSTFARFLSAYEPENPLHFRALHHLYAAKLRERDAWNLLDTLEEPALGEGVPVLYNGRRLTLDLLQSVDELYRMQEALGFAKEDPIVFCELGAGYGRLAQVVLAAMPNAKYWIFDLPESLVLSQSYLTAVHPKAKAALYPESAELLGKPGALDDVRLFFGLPHLLRKLPPSSIDVFINIYSFMEMHRRQVETYFDIITRLDPRLLFLKQHHREINFLDKTVHDAETYPVLPGWKQVYHGTSTLFDHVFEASWRIRQ